MLNSYYGLATSDRHETRRLADDPVTDTVTPLYDRRLRASWSRCRFRTSDSALSSGTYRADQRTLKIQRGSDIQC